MGTITRVIRSSLTVAGLSLLVVTIGYAADAEPTAAATDATSAVERSPGLDASAKPADPAPITLHLDDVDVRKALELLSRQCSLNILVSRGVAGRVTANLEGLSLDDTLNAILKLCNLAVHRERGLIYVYTPEELVQQNQKGGKVSTRVYHLKYLRATDVEKLITPFLGTDSGRVAVTPASEVGIGSQTDQAGGDSLAGSDVVIVQDYESVLQTIDELIARLDVQPVQVLIEAVITEVQLENSKDLGVNFAVLDGAGRVLTAIGNGAELNAIGAFNPTSILAADNKLPGSSTAGFAPDTHGVKFGFVDKDVTGFIRALERVGELKVLASPRIMVLNKQRAELIIGERIGFKTLTVTETHAVEKVEFLNVGTQLRLRPFVGNDGMIRMEIHPERSTGKVVDGLPSTSTSEVTTNVIVPDGSTVVIAGLMQDEDELVQSGVPGLSKLRWVGPLFRQKFAAKKKRELIVLLTPRIWNPALPDAPQAGKPAAATESLARLDVRCDGPSETARGERCRAKVTVSNVGSRPAMDLRLQSLTPDGMAAMTGSPSVWEIGTLKPGQSQVIETAFDCSQSGTMLVRFLVTGRDNLASEARQTIQVREPQPRADTPDRRVESSSKPRSSRPAAADECDHAADNDVILIAHVSDEKAQPNNASPPANESRPRVRITHIRSKPLASEARTSPDGH